MSAVNRKDKKSCMGEGDRKKLKSKNVQQKRQNGRISEDRICQLYANYHKYLVKLLKVNKNAPDT